jgi:hypothetical protein
MRLEAALLLTSLLSADAAGLPKIQNGTFLPEYNGGSEYYYEVRATRSPRASQPPATAADHPLRARRAAALRIRASAMRCPSSSRTMTTT